MFALDYGRLMGDPISRGKTLKRINVLLEAAARDPFTGIGKPEPLRGDLSGFWSRRIDDVNRLVYEATEGEIRVIACRYYYGSG